MERRNNENVETTATLNEKPASSGAGSNTGLKF